MKKVIFLLFLAVFILTACNKPTATPSAIVATPTVVSTPNPFPYIDQPTIDGVNFDSEYQTGLVHCSNSPDWFKVHVGRGISVRYYSAILEDSNWREGKYSVFLSVLRYMVSINDRVVYLPDNTVYQKIGAGLSIEKDPDEYLNLSKKIVNHSLPMGVVVEFEYRLLTEREKSHKGVEYAWMFRACRFEQFTEIK